MRIIGKQARRWSAGMAVLVLTLGMVPAVRGALAAGTDMHSRHGVALPAAAHHLTPLRALPAGLAPALRRALARDAAAHRTASGPAATTILPGTTWTQQAELTAPGGAIGDRFGFAVSVSGTTALVGAPNMNDRMGEAFVFVRSGTTWTQQQVITPTDAHSGDLFGWSVALTGDTAIIGAPNKSSLAGAAYIFVRNGTTWTQQAELTLAHPLKNNLFGYSVGISGNTVAVGTDNRNTPGAAYVFVRSGTSWILEKSLTASDGATGDLFGSAVALSGNTALIGAGTKNNTTGAAYIFVRNGTTWTQQIELTDTSGTAYDGFGSTVALSGNTALIGEPGKNSLTGAAYVYTNSSGTWTQQATLTIPGASIDTTFGNAVALAGPTAVVGAEFGNSQVGAAYVFARSGTTWSQQAQLLPSSTGRGNYFGCSVGNSGGTALIGAYGNLDHTGAAFVFVRNGSAERQD